MSTPEGTQARWQIGSALRALQTTVSGPQRPLRDLEVARHARDDVLAALDLLADAARREGATFGQIGRALGISRQAARQAALIRGRHQLVRDEDRQWRMPLTQRTRSTRRPPGHAGRRTA